MARLALVELRQPVGRRIRYSRRKRRMTVSVLAQRLGVSPGQVLAMENGYMLDRQLVAAVAWQLGVRETDLYPARDGDGFWRRLGEQMAHLDSCGLFEDPAA